MKNPKAQQKEIGKKFSLAILISIVVHFILLVVLGLWTVYRYVQQGDPGLEVAMEQAEEEAAVEEIEIEEVEIDEVEPQVEIDLDRLTVDPIHDIPLPEIVADAQAVPTPPTPTVPTQAADRVAFRQAGGTPNIEWDQMSTSEFSEQLMEMRFYRSNDAWGDVEEFARNGFDRSFFEDFEEIGDPEYAGHILHQRMSSEEISANLERDLSGNFIIHLRGNITPLKDGRYRFFTASDQVIAVGINGKLVSARQGMTSSTHSFAGVNLSRTGGYDSVGWGRIFFQFGEWIEMNEGETYEIEIVTGYRGRGRYSGMLLVQQENVDYRETPAGPVLPIFSVVPLPENIEGEIGEGIPPLHEPPFLKFPNNLP
ncbi:MAG: hypothetical protein JJT75_13195 [Opitutales bacterium]|nr:hypothetical protein [Opitutales bacterium]MCH8541553.1 hypothetical protein [Opitutales bacterium]